MPDPYMPIPQGGDQYTQQQRMLQQQQEQRNFMQQVQAHAPELLPPQMRNATGQRNMTAGWNPEVQQDQNDRAFRDSFQQQQAVNAQLQARKDWFSRASYQDQSQMTSLEEQMHYIATDPTMTDEEKQQRAANVRQLMGALVKKLPPPDFNTDKLQQYAKAHVTEIDGHKYWVNEKNGGLEPVEHGHAATGEDAVKATEWAADHDFKLKEHEDKMALETQKLADAKAEREAKAAETKAKDEAAKKEAGQKEKKTKEDTYTKQQIEQAKLDYDQQLEVWKRKYAEFQRKQSDYDTQLKNYQSDIAEWDAKEAAAEADPTLREKVGPRPHWPGEPPKEPDMPKLDLAGTEQKAREEFQKRNPDQPEPPAQQQQGQAPFTPTNVQPGHIEPLPMPLGDIQAQSKQALRMYGGAYQAWKSGQPPPPGQEGLYAKFKQEGETVFFPDQFRKSPQFMKTWADTMAALQRDVNALKTVTDPNEAAAIRDRAAPYKQRANAMLAMMGLSELLNAHAAR